MGATPPSVRRWPLGVEDALLAGWNGLGVPLVGASALAPILALGDAPHLAAGLVQLAAVLGAIVAIATRPSGPHPPSPLTPRASGPTEARMAFIGPLVGAVAFVAGSASAYIGVGLDGPVIGTAFLAVVASLVLGDRLPVLDAGLRRALLLPFILVCAGIFDAFAADMLGELDVPALLSSLALDETGFGLFVLGMVLAGLAAFYASLVVAPRMLVNPERTDGCLVWPLRFVVYVVSAALGIGWLTAVAG